MEVHNRRIDDMGRIWIPKVIRKLIGIEEGDAVSIVADEDAKTILIKKDGDQQQ
jgi:AbrB family looped-hinge helix DNA binding protein